MEKSSFRTAIRTAWVVIAAFSATAIAIIVIGNRMRNEVTLELIEKSANLTVLKDDTITVATWNLGYGGLGAESDFKVDGGEKYLPPSRAVVEKNIAGIATELQAIVADVIVIQEAARASLLTRGADLVCAVGDALSGRDTAFSADFTIRFLPRSLTPRHGLLTSASVAGAKREIVLLPLEPQYIFGLSRRLYHLQVTRVPFAGGEWSIIDLHLSAFDKGANVRMKQLKAAIDFAKSEYSAGKYVVMGGDWNLEFFNPGRPANTEQKYLFWIHPFPREELPVGWSAVFDEKTPSVRTNERPYKKSENYTTIIDGFVISPNVLPVNVNTVDLDFQFSDHQPVIGKFQIKPE